MFTGVADSVSWATINVPSDKMVTRRKLVEVRLSSSQRKLNRATQLFLRRIVIVTIAVIPLMIIHAICIKWYEYRTQKHVEGLLGFPGLQITVSMFLMNPIIDAAAAFIKLGTWSGVLAGFGILCILPIPVIVYVTWFLRTYVHSGTAVVYNVQQEDRVQMSAIRRLLSSDPGEWTYIDHKKSRFIKAHEVFFADFAGRLQKADAVYEYDRQNSTYRRFQTRTLQERILCFIPYFGVFVIAKNVVNALLLAAWPDSSSGSVAQSAILAVLQVAHLVLMIGFVPLSAMSIFVTEVVNTFGEFGTYVQALALTLKPSWVPYIDKGMLVTQLLSVGVNITLQVMTVYVIVKETIHMIRYRKAVKTFTRSVSNVKMQYVSVKKYANRWMYRALGRTLKDWPAPETRAKSFMSSFSTVKRARSMPAPKRNSPKSKGMFYSDGETLGSMMLDLDDLENVEIRRHSDAGQKPL